VDEDPFSAGGLFNGMLVTALVGLCLVLTPTFVAVPVLMVLAFLCGRVSGRDAAIGSIAVGAFMFGYAITEPHFEWEIQNSHDIALYGVLVAGSLAASEVGVRLRRRHVRQR